MKFIFFVVFLFAIAVLSGCDHFYILFGINNQSAKNIYFTISTAYPDTSINIGNIPSDIIDIPSDVIPPGQQYNQMTPSTQADFFSSIPFPAGSPPLSIPKSRGLPFPVSWRLPYRPGPDFA